MIVTSDKPVVAVGRLHLGGDVASFDGFTGGDTLVYAPTLFKNMWTTYNSTLTVQNIDPVTTAHMTIHFYDVNGNLSCIRNDDLPPLGIAGFLAAQPDL